MIKHIIWDWNGTLLDDAEYSVGIINKILTKYILSNLTLEKYREIFTFPVINYYEKIGLLDKVNFLEVGREFIDNYEKDKYTLKLFNDTIEILEYFNKNNISQTILSAYSDGALKELVSFYKIEKYFDNIIGISNIYAEGKLESGKIFIKNNDLDPQHYLLIGDTLHDLEISKELGIRCILISSGHQSKKILISSGAEVLNTLSELKKLEIK